MTLKEPKYRTLEFGPLRPIRADVQRDVLNGLAQVSEKATIAYQGLQRRYTPRETLEKLREIDALTKNLITKLEEIA